MCTKKRRALPNDPGFYTVCETTFQLTTNARRTTMAMHRANKAPAVCADSTREAWFCANRIRQRRRDHLSRQMRKAQRRIAKGKR